MPPLSCAEPGGEGALHDALDVDFCCVVSAPCEAASDACAASALPLLRQCTPYVHVPRGPETKGKKRYASEYNSGGDDGLVLGFGCNRDTDFRCAPCDAAHAPSDGGTTPPSAPSGQPSSDDSSGEAPEAGGAHSPHAATAPTSAAASEAGNALTLGDTALLLVGLICLCAAVCFVALVFHRQRRAAQKDERAAHTRHYSRSNSRGGAQQPHSHSNANVSRRSRSASLAKRGLARSGSRHDAAARLSRNVSARKLNNPLAPKASALSLQPTLLLSYDTSNFNASSPRAAAPKTAAQCGPEVNAYVALPDSGGGAATQYERLADLRASAHTHYTALPQAHHVAKPASTPYSNVSALKAGAVASLAKAPAYDNQPVSLQNKRPF